MVFEHHPLLTKDSERYEGWNGGILGSILFASFRVSNFSLEGVWWYSSTTLGTKRVEGYGGWNGGMLGSICLSPIKVPISTWRGFGGIRAPPSLDQESGGVRWMEWWMLGSIESNQSPNFNLEGVWWYWSTTLSG